MSLPPYDPRNETEIGYWNGAGGRNWVRRQEGQDTILAPILRATLERAAVHPGERVVDIGCGTGAASIELGERVGISGHVLGVDVSEPMLARAAERRNELSSSHEAPKPWHWENWGLTIPHPIGAVRGVGTLSGDEK